MTKEDAVKAVDRAFDAAVARLFDVFVSGLSSGDSAAVLTARATKGFDNAVKTHGHMLAVVDHQFPEH
ncbi:hypothetical protein SAMN05216337_1017155 [Bradyrhizobium brasilense]|uniref:Uncharacterized protein n=1 Tax=Bradyrhizobium brasilense TaxID=1419277 RepID=A0A1G6YZP1_9BRAD|nr:hypothetical protein [Bradyrhizobium brasilense]SDD95808.1 hypothetical protein SAMN05216337_1017155 [Bradyrhizobium brasilense]